MGRGISTLILALSLALPAWAETVGQLREKRPELFHRDTGYRIARQRAPTPDDIPGNALRIDARGAAALIEQGALAIDVFGASQSVFDPLDGAWLISEPRESLPGAVWLPEVGRGTLTPEMTRYFEDNLLALTGGDPSHPLVFFCVADCWMSWNAAQRADALGFERVYWFREGTDGWLDIGLTLQPVEPVPVNVDF